MRPNVLFVAIDDLNSWIGCLGTNPDVKTPNIDRLAAEGMLFTNAVCPSPICNPSRTSILTGLRPSTSGCYLLNDLLATSPEKARTMPLPLYFRRNGYTTMSGGKVDHGDTVEHATKGTWGESMWDELAGQFGGQQFEIRSRHARTLTDVGSFWSIAQHWGPLDDKQAADLADGRVVEWASDRLVREYDEPFFLAAGFFRPHTPLIAPKRFFDMHPKESLTLPPTGPCDMNGMPAMARQIALAGWQDLEGGSHRQIVEHDLWRDVVQAYLACVSFADYNVGRVLDALSTSPHADNTVVVLWSDNGWALGEHFHWRKMSLWDSGARVPFIVKAPGVTRPGSRCDDGVSLVDIYPTLVELCDLPRVDALEGESLVGLLSGRETDRELPGLTSFGPHNHSLRTSRWRYTIYADGTEELYDYRRDPNEHENLASRDEYGEVKRSLTRWFPEINALALTSSPPPGEPLELVDGQQVWFRGSQPGFDDRRLEITARVGSCERDAVIVHHSGWYVGYALYLLDGRLHFAVMDVPRPLRWDRLDASITTIAADTPVPVGDYRAGAVLELDGTMLITLDEEEVARGKADGALSTYPAGLLETGRYTGDEYPERLRHLVTSDRPRFPALGAYTGCKEFPGTLEGVRITFGEQPG